MCGRVVSTLNVCSVAKCKYPFMILLKIEFGVKSRQYALIIKTKWSVLGGRVCGRVVMFAVMPNVNICSGYQQGLQVPKRKTVLAEH